jgi:hypothetical protein
MLHIPRIKHSNQTCSPEQEKHRREEPPQVEGTKKWGWSMAGEIGKANKFHTNAWMIEESRVIRPAYLSAQNIWLGPL